MKVLVTYSSGNTMVLSGWTHGMIERMRASWAEIREPRSTATIEIIGDDDEDTEAVE